MELVGRSSESVGWEPPVGPVATLGLLAAAALVLAPPALAQDDTSARVEPDLTAPGQDLSLIFSISSPELAEVVVQERVTCTVSFPDGTERDPCEKTGSLAEVHTTGSGAREYVFPYQAPGVSGSYEVAFEADSTARVLPASHTATASFTVDETLPVPQADDPPGDDPTVGENEDPSDEQDGGSTDEASGDDEETVAGVGRLGGPGGSRLMVTTAMATGVLTVALVANRHPLGGRWR